ncbi:MAG: NAD-dependent epimerase/dehydratase family protein, partial [Acutalibacteraceae bacterium]
VPWGIRATALLQAEESCRFYSERLNRDVVILRLDRLYDIPKDKKEAALGICEHKCLDAFRDGTVTYKRNYKYGLTYMGDVIESIYKLIACEKHNYGLYHISSGKAFSELQIVDAIDNSLKNELEKIDNTLEEQNAVILSNKRFADEFGFEIRYSPEEIIQKTLAYMRKHSGRFLDSSHPGLSIWRRIYYKTLQFLGAWVPYIENLVLFIPFFMLNNRATESQYFSKIDFYLIFVLLFAVVHGQRQATFSALLATGGYIFRQMYNHSGIAVMTDYNTYVWISEIFIVGLVVGYMKDQIVFLKEEKEQEAEFLSERVTDITDINDSNLRVKEGLITQVVNYDYSLGMVYDMVDRLGEDDPTKILFRALNLIREVADCREVSIYRIDEHDDARLFGYTSEKAASMGHTVYLPDKEPLYDAVTKDIVYLNRTMDAEYPMMAYTVCEDGRPRMMIMLWSIPLERMTIDESNRLTVFGKLVGKAVKRAEAYLELLKSERFADDGSVFKAQAFSELIDTYREAKKNNLTDYMLLRVTSPDAEKAVPVISDALHSFDSIGYGTDGGLWILLTGRGREECNALQAELSQNGISTAVSGETE